jgi:hypothetical protein
MSRTGKVTYAGTSSPIRVRGITFVMRRLVSRRHAMLGCVSLITQQRRTANNRSRVPTRSVGECANAAVGFVGGHAHCIHALDISTRAFSYR